MSQYTHNIEMSKNMTFKSMHTCSINPHITTLPTLASLHIGLGLRLVLQLGLARVS